MDELRQSNHRLKELVATLSEAISTPPFVLHGNSTEAIMPSPLGRNLQKVVALIDVSDPASVEAAVCVGGDILRRLKEWADDAIYGGDAVPYQRLASKLRRLGLLDACLKKEHCVPEEAK